MNDYPLFLDPPKSKQSGLMSLADMLAVQSPPTSTVVDALIGRSIPIGQRESANVMDERNFANEDALTRANAYLAGPVAGGVVQFLKRVGNIGAPEMTMQEIGALLPQDDSRLPQFAAPGMRR